MGKNVMVIAGPSGSKSTFGGGLRQHVQRKDQLAIEASVQGNETDYVDGVVDRMWSQGKYPEETFEGYILTYTIGANSYRIPTTEITLIDLPGQDQRALLDPDDPDRMGLIRRIRRGLTDDRATIEQDYETDIEPEFLRGQTPITVDDWETTFLYHFYTADEVIFLMNLHRIVYQTQQNRPATLIYGTEELAFADETFANVAVVPTAVDVLGYDPESFDPSIGQRVMRALLSPRIFDRELADQIESQIDPGVDQNVADVINHVQRNAEIDFFGVSVPDRNYDTGELTDDGQGGFEVRGFEQVIEWLK